MINVSGHVKNSRGMLAASKALRYMEEFIRMNPIANTTAFVKVKYMGNRYVARGGYCLANGESLTCVVAYD